jgi:hypothetical protein
MDVPILRKLTEKSILGFGKYADCAVKHLLDINETQYLRWVYFNSSRITFIDEILDKIRIPIEFRINKPGTNSEMHEKCNEYNLNKLNGFTKFKKQQHSKRKRKARLISKLRVDSMKYTKGIMQAINQGKGSF